MTGQAAFGGALLDPAMPAPDGLKDGDGRPAGRRFAVYRNNVAVSLSEALEAAFPIVARLVGAEFFKAMAGVYCRAHPPASPLMMFYGRDFPDFLAGFPPVAHLPYLPDVARLELALRESYHAADADPLPAQALGSVPPDDLAGVHLTFAPAVVLVSSNYPLHGIWASNTGRADAPGSGAQPCLVTRPAFDPIVTVLTPEAAAILTALMQGAPLGEAARAAPDHLAPLLQSLLAGGAIVALI